MSTTLAKLDLGTDQWVEMPATWKAYLSLLAARGEKGRPRYTYLDGRLTAVSPGVPHEFFKTRLGGWIEDILVGLNIPHVPLGSVTLLRSRKAKEGAEADETYYLTRLERIEGKRHLVMGEDPAPDLVVEVVVSHQEADSLEAYRRFGVREVWVVRATGVEFLALGEDQHYTPTPESKLLPFLSSEELNGWLFRPGMADSTRLRREFRTWIETTLVPRHRPEDGV